MITPAGVLGFVMLFICSLVGWGLEKKGLLK